MNTLPDHLSHLNGLTMDDLIVAEVEFHDGVKVETQRIVAGDMSRGEFVTEIFADDVPEIDGWRHWYATREEAVEGHLAVAEAVRVGSDPERALRRRPRRPETPEERSSHASAAASARWANASEADRLAGTAKGRAAAESRFESDAERTEHMRALAEKSAAVRRTRKAAQS